MGEENKAAIDVCLMGGSFDPPHLGHMAMAKAAADELDVEIVFLPAGDPPQKSGVTPSTQRLEMLKLAIAESGFGDSQRYRIDTREFIREGTSYTSLTIREILAEAPEVKLGFLLGSDQIVRLNTWRDAAYLCEKLVFVVALREPQSAADLEPLISEASERIGAEIRYLPLNMPLINISSTQVRESFASGQFEQGLVCSGVAQYIDDHGLYREDARGDR